MYVESVRRLRHFKCWCQEVKEFFSCQCSCLGLFKHSVFVFFTACSLEEEGGSDTDALVLFQS